MSRFWGHREVPASPANPDAKLSLLLTAATAQAFDWPAWCDLVRFTLGSTAASLTALAFVDMATTNAAVPTTGAVITTGSSGGLMISGNFERTYQRPRASTGFSVVAPSSFQFCAEFWSRAATTA